MFLIGRGVVRVCRGEKDQEVDLATLMAGDFFGEIALLHDEPRSATCRTGTPCLLYELRRDVLSGLMEKCPLMKRAMEEAAKKRSDRKKV